MAVANSIDWSLGATITRKSAQFSHHSTTKTKIGFRFISILFLNPNSKSSRPAKTDSSAVLVGDAPVIELALKLEEFQHLPENDADCKEVNSIICCSPGFKPLKYTMKLARQVLDSYQKLDSVALLLSRSQRIQSSCSSPLSSRPPSIEIESGGFHGLIQSNSAAIHMQLIVTFHGGIEG